MSKSKLWGGVFSEEPDDLAWSFGQSIATDVELWREELEVSIAHVEMLGETGIVSDVSKMLTALYEMLADGSWLASHEDAEDIHAAVESELLARIGDDALRLATARSRNDQIATVTRLWVMRRCIELSQSVRELQEVLLRLGEKHKGDAMPGYTHMQPAQPITLGFHLLTYFWMLQRDRFRFEAVRSMAAEHCPLGSGALGGSSLPIDRASTAKTLGFTGPSPSAQDSVSDRDFVGDTLHALATLMQHLSRLSQELAVWSTSEYGFVRVGDAFSTGSSLMPQKRNPDIAELIRGRSATVIGHWTAFMSMMRGLPLAYNRDMQDDKPPLFEGVKISKASLALMKGMLSTAQFDTERMRERAAVGGTTATGLAELLVGSGMAFREAHDVAGKVVLECEKRGWELDALTPEQLGELGVQLSGSIEVLRAGGNIESKAVRGGPSSVAMRDQIVEAKAALERWVY